MENRFYVFVKNSLNHFFFFFYKQEYRYQILNSWYELAVVYKYWLQVAQMILLQLNYSHMMSIKVPQAVFLTMTWKYLPVIRWMPSMKFHLVLGLFHIFLNYITFEIESMFINFAIDVKVWVTASILEDKISIESDFDKLVRQCRNNRWNSKEDKSQVLHLHRNNLFKYRIENNWLGKSSSQKGLRL